MRKFFYALARGGSPFSCSTEDLSEWLDDTELALFEKVGILAREEKSAPISCPACGEHMTELEYRGTTPEGKRWYIARCEDAATGVLDLIGDYFSYRVTFESIADFFAKSLGVKDGVQRITEDLYRLGTVKIYSGSVRCFFFFGDSILKHEVLFAESSKTASTIVITVAQGLTALINSIVVVDPAELLATKGKTLVFNKELFNQAAEKAFGQNSYQNRTLFVRGKPIATFSEGTKEDIVLSHISSPIRINRSTSYSDILAHYNAVSPSVAKSKKKATGAKQWCYQLLTDIRSKCTDETRDFVDIAIHHSGKKSQENGLTFVSRG